MYPTYSRPERIADGTMHTLGVIGAITGAFLLMLWAVGTTSATQTWALAVYGVGMIATFTASASYHMTPWPALRPLLRRFDHAAIYLMIAGTYTPLVVILGTTFGYVLLGIIWALAIIGIILKLFFWQIPGRFGPALYLIMGWMSVGLIWALWSILPGTATTLITAGGLIYSVGVIFYASKMKFSTAIWHGFVVAASACFWAAIVIGTFATIP